MKTVQLEMNDLLNGGTVTRQIDISNIFTGSKPATKENQTDLLNNWINQRGNQQHDTVLELVSFSIVDK
jgi:hypothetical protein